MWKQYYTVDSIKDALNILDSEGESAKIIAGGTDLVLELKNGLHPEINTLIDVTRIKGQDRVWIEDEFVYLGLATTHNQCLVSQELIDYGFPLVQAAHSVGAPQIRNVGTVIGNLVTASPANDTITPLVALDADVFIRSKKKEYSVKLIDFYKGVRKTVLKTGEMVTGIRFKKLESNQKGAFIKYLLRETHAISVANVCAILTGRNSNIEQAVITLGAVAPTIIHSQKAEIYLRGKKLSADVIDKSAELAKQDALPIDDIRSSEQYRSHLIPVLIRKALKSIQTNSRDEYKNQPVLLWGNQTKFITPLEKTTSHDKSIPINTIINGEEKSFENGQDHTLLSLIRNQAHLTGTKLGCGEGECGACTMFLNGLPVFSCLVPAPKAHHCEITTIEGISKEKQLHPIQEAFIEAGAVQCGYCTPGFIMSAVKLLEEKPQPTEFEIKQGLAGNICRCTGYYSIIKAVDMAAGKVDK